MEHLTSRQNPLIKYIRSLRQRKGRERESRFVIEGVRLLEEALRATGRPEGWFCLETVLFSPDLSHHPRGQKLIAELAEREVKMYTAANELFPYLADTINPQGIIGIVQRTNFLPGRVFTPEVEVFNRFSESLTKPLILVLDRLQDPGNLGTLLRTAEATGVSEIWLTPGTVDPFSSKVIRASMGSIFRVPLRTEVEPSLISNLGQAGVRLVATSVDKGQPYYQSDFCGPTAILLGNEGSGLSSFLTQKSQEIITIPLGGEVESLNVAVAGAILLFEARRQRESKNLN
ncbi:MAG: RNA methyltransferase [Syntrophomonadaceae bacterium]|nr:RNA methyltransferase [Syntrophomonadaceae bacterium]